MDDEPLGTKDDEFLEREPGEVVQFLNGAEVAARVFGAEDRRKREPFGWNLRLDAASVSDRESSLSASRKIFSHLAFSFSSGVAGTEPGA